MRVTADVSAMKPLDFMFECDTCGIVWGIDMAVDDTPVILRTLDDSCPGCQGHSSLTNKPWKYGK